MVSVLFWVGMNGGLGLLFKSVADHCSPGLDTHSAVGDCAGALDADTRIDDLFQYSPVDYASVVETDELAVCDEVVLVWLEEEEVGVFGGIEGFRGVSGGVGVCHVESGDVFGGYRC